MRLLHTSDWHLGKTLSDFSLWEDQRHVLKWLLRLAEEEGVDALLLSGDVYHRPIPGAEAIRLYDDLLSEAVLGLHIPVLAVAGNHDSGARLEFASRLLESSGYHIAGRPSRQIKQVELADEHGPVCFWLLPYLFPADVRALIPGCDAKTFDTAYRALLEENLPRLNPTKRNVILSHGFFSGKNPVIESESELSVGGMDLVNSDVFDAFDYTALGHLHAPQTVGEGVRYSGSPLKYSLSEEGQKKSVTLVELGAPGKGATCREIPVPALRDVRRVRGSFDQLMEPSWHQNRGFEDYVFAEITDLGALYAVDKLRTLFPRLMGVSFPNRDHTGDIVEIGALREKMTAEQHFRRFYRESRGEELPEEALAVLREAIARVEEREREAHL